MGHLNGILARVGGNLNNNFQKSQMLGGLPGSRCKESQFYGLPFGQVAATCSIYVLAQESF